MTKRIISLIVCLSLLLSMIVLPSAAEEETTPVAVPRQNFEIVAEWIHGTDVRSLGAETIVDRCAKNGITDIYLLTKGTGGMLGYNKTQFTDAITGELDCLEAMTTAAHAKGIRLHAWLCCMEDENYKANNPESGMWHYVRARDNNRINPYDEGYQTYMAAIVTEILEGYDVDGIHLDYIRYNHLANGWGAEDFAALEAMGAKEEDVRYIIDKTFYQDRLPEGETVDAQYAFKALRDGDPTAIAIAEYRRNNIVEFATVIKDAIEASGKDVIFSGALQPEGGVKGYDGSDDWAFADLHYGQNYADAADLYDYICPMAYSPTFGKAPDWMTHIAERSVELGNDVVMGLQTYYPMTSAGLMADIEAVRGVEGVRGIVHFRHTQFGYSRASFDLNAGELDLHLINTYSSGYRWVKIEAAKGVTITGATYGEGFNAEAPIVIAEDGSSVLLGFEDESGYVMETEGDVHLTIEGAPEGDTPIALTRIYLTNESRAYCSFEDRTQYEVKFVDFDGTEIATKTTSYGGTVSIENPRRPGYLFLGWDTDFSCVTENLTVTATYREIAPTNVADGFEIVGEWVHGTEINELGADVVVDRCAKNGITDIYLLVKGTGGTLGYLKTQYPEALSRTNRDMLQETIDAAHAAGIRVHAWLSCMEDAFYKANNPEAGLWHYVRGRDNNIIDLANEEYQEYMKNIATEIATGYDVDGIHFDYIRYNHLANGWAEKDFAALEAMGAKEEDVRYLINKTFYQDRLPEGETVDADYIFDAYRNGDPTALLIGQYRRNNVNNFAEMVFAAAAEANPDLILSGATMPEGGILEGGVNDYAFADLHYGQNYADLGAICDYICPMAYTTSYGEDASWMAEIATNSIEMGCNVVMGLASWYPATSTGLMADINILRDLLPMEGLLGIVHFRHSQFGYGRFDYNYTAGTMKLDVINTYASAGYRWIKLEAAEGLKITGVTYGEGFNAEAPIVIAEDGSSVLLGYEDESGWLMEALAEGTLYLTTEGEPTEAKAYPVLMRIYITNESRAFNVYDNNTIYNVTFVDYDGTVLSEQEVAYGEAATAPAENPRRPGYRFMGWDTSYDCISGNTTVTAIYREIPQSDIEGDQIVAEWIHGTEINTLGADVVVDRCAKNGITDIYLLVKGTGGTLGFLKTQYTEALSRTNRDMLQETIDAAHAVGIRVHAWLCCMEDSLYKANHEEAAMWHYVRGRDNDRINPYDPGYQEYMYNITTEILTGYDVDGIHLDYIRYNHLANGWSAGDFKALEEMGVKEEDVRYLINKTFYQDRLPEGETVDAQYAFKALRDGDPTAIAISEYRRNNVVDFAENIKAAITASGKDVIYSAALQPEGGINGFDGSDDWAFADMHYGQNYSDAAELYDYICPMAYAPTFGQGAEWMAHLAETSVALGNKVVMGLQSYYPMLSAELMEEINAVEDIEGVLGIVHFRHSQFSYAKFTYDLNRGVMALDLINTYADAGYRWVKVEAAEGVKITGVTYGEGMNAEAPVVIAEDGSSVLLGYEDESGWLMDALAEGRVTLTFEGAPAEGEDIALARIYITNESRAYNVYRDVTTDMPFEDVNFTDWFFEDVLNVYEMGLMNGVSETEFAPEDNTTRAMLVTTLYRLAGEPSIEGMECPFTDVILESWYGKAVVWAYNMGITTGTTETEFAPDELVTREQVATFLYRYAEAEAVEADLTSFPDADTVSEYAKDAVAWCVANGIIKGDLDKDVTYLNPTANATRAQIAAILARFAQMN